MSVVAVYVIFPNVAEAMHIGRLVVEERLAACINIFAPCTSIYRWRGEVEQSDETPALLKTSTEVADALIARLAELHSYEIPAISAWPIEHLPATLAAWVAESMSVP